MNPKVILFDEPTSALDPEMIGEVTKLMRDIKDADLNMTMIIVSHEMKFIKDFCSRVVFLDEGKVIEDGTPNEIFNHPKRARTKAFISNQRILDIMIDGSNYDLNKLNNQLLDFCNSQRLNAKEIYCIQSVLEELVIENIFAHKNNCINCETAYVSNTLS